MAALPYAPLLLLVKRKRGKVCPGVWVSVERVSTNMKGLCPFPSSLYPSQSTQIASAAWLPSWGCRMPGEQLWKKPRAGNPTTGDVQTRDFSKLFHPEAAPSFRCPTLGSAVGRINRIWTLWCHPEGGPGTPGSKEVHLLAHPPGLTALGQSSRGNGAWVGPGVQHLSRPPRPDGI